MGRQYNYFISPEEELDFMKELYWDMVNGCPIIKHCHCRINEEHNSLSSGRFYLNTWYKDEIESFDMVYKGFQKLARMMKKRLYIRGMKLNLKMGKPCIGQPPNRRLT